MIIRLRLRNPLKHFKQSLEASWYLGDRLLMGDNTQVTIYTNYPEAFPAYNPIQSLKDVQKKSSVTVSVVVTARNERETAQALIDSLLNQSRLPDEIIAVDTGSQDGTQDLLHIVAASSPITMRIIELEDANIAQGRNTGIEQAHGEVIAITDFGCVHRHDWLENLVAPFEINPNIQVSAGRYEPVDQNGQPAMWPLWVPLSSINPQDYLPPSVSVAFCREAWERVGGYPEWLNQTGEDTYFDLELKSSTNHWAFVPEAIAYWQPPSTYLGSWQKAFNWSVGNGEVGMNTKAYCRLLSKLSFLIGIPLVAVLLLLIWGITGLSGFGVTAIVLALLWLGLLLEQYTRKGRSVKRLWLEYTMNQAEILGYLKGVRQRPQIDQIRMVGMSGVIFIMAGVPIDDTGGGARWTQIALELLRRQYLVFFINKFQKHESKELFLDFKHPNLIEMTVSNFNWPSLLEKYRPALINKEVIGLVELPLGDFIPIIEHLRTLNSVVIYDLLDAWDTSLGGKWYDPETEQQIINSSDLLLATVPGLKQELASHTDKCVHLVPNAVNSYLFNPEQSWSRPADFPEAEWNIIYIGALWGEWFDWELLAQISENYPEAGVIVIGDTMGREFDLPENVHFLGLKSQRILPAYLHYSQVAIVPWKVNPITQMTSPLKVYEFIAMYKPVVAPVIDPLKNIPGVFLSESRPEFIQMVGELRDFNPPKMEMTQFIKKNDWLARVDQILELSNQVRNVAEYQE